jgi:RNA 3'-phosphate cyclase
MILIDGSFGESGGQILRSSIGLAALLKKPMKVINIRKGRCNPGLRAQHLVGVKVAGEFCNADVKGLEIGSLEVEFVPHELNITDKKIDIGTAGSISLLLQTLTPILIFSDKEVTLEVIGGTNGLGAPPISFFKHVTNPLLSKLGANVSIEIVKYGYYPKGGGLVKVKFKPVKKLKSIHLVDPGKLLSVKGVAVAGSLPSHVAEREAKAAEKILRGYGVENVEIETVVTKTLSQGTSLTLWAEYENTVLGSDELGERGVPAEKIGEAAAKGLVKSIESKAALDKYMADQLIPFIALAEGKSTVTVEEITQHCLTNISVTEKILGVRFDVDAENRRIEVNGIGLENKYI